MTFFKRNCFFDVMGKMIKSKINNLIVSSKKRINWKVVEEYLKKYDDTVIIIEETTESVNIDKHFIDEYVGSKYTRSLKGTNALVKANIPIILEEIIKNSYNKRHIDDYNFKHKSFAKGGWNRYNSLIYLCQLEMTAKKLLDIVNIE